MGSSPTSRLARSCEPAENTPYLLAGFGYSTFADVINEKRGRTDWVLTAEAGYLVRRNEGVHEIVIGIRGIVPVASQVYTDSAPALPVVIVIAKLLW